MDDVSRRTWSNVFLTLSATVGFAFLARWVRWQDDGVGGGPPDVLWTIGSLALGFLLVALQLRLPLWLRAWVEAGRGRDDPAGR